MMPSPSNKEEWMTYWIEAARNDYAAYSKCSKAFLVDEYKLSHRISDTREMTKGALVSAIIEGKYGRRVMEAAFG
jgi:hypothetical protein